jgi:HSP20 family protein
MRRFLDWKESDIFRDMDDAFGNLIGRDFDVDLIEKDNEYTLKAELPGFNKENIEVDFSPQGELTISCKKQEETVTEGKYFRKEIRSGSYTRKFVFAPESIKADEIEAAYTDGVLTLTIPRIVEPAKPDVKKIEVK